MNAYNFTERTRHVLSLAREEAHRLRTPYTDADHIALGLIREREGVGSVVLESLAGDLLDLGRTIEQAMPVYSNGTAGSGDLPFTSIAKRVLEHSMAIAGELDHRYVGTEHILLGLLREGQARTAMLLSSRGISYESARAAVLRLLGAPEAQDASQPSVMALSADIELHLKDGTTTRKHCASLDEAMRFLIVHSLQ